MPPRKKPPTGAENESARQSAEEVLGRINQPPALKVLGLDYELVEKDLKDDQDLLVVANGLYKTLSSIHHPDKGGSQDRFQEIQGAIEAIREAPVAERKLLLASSKSKPRTKKPATKSSPITYREVSTNRDSRDRNIEAYFSTFSAESVQHIESGDFLLTPVSIYKASQEPTTQHLRYERGGGIKVRNTSRLGQIAENSDEAKPYSELFAVCEDDGNTEVRFVNVSDGVARIAEDKQGGHKTIGTGLQVIDGWYDLRGAGSGRSITPIEEISDAGSVDGLILFGSLTSDEITGLQKYTTTSKDSTRITRDALIEGKVEATYPTKAEEMRAKKLLDEQFTISQENMRKIVSGWNIATLSSCVRVDEVLIGLSSSDQTGYILGKVVAQITTRDF